MKVLIVDDSSTMRKILTKTVQQAGGDTILEAEDGIDALKKLAGEAHDVDLIMLDINMPRVDGVTTLKEIKKLDAIKHIPVIMCTSEAEKEIVIECIKSGASDYVVKPFSKDVIASKIEKLVKK